MQEIAVALFNIIILNLVLSGDNAVVIGMAAHRLPARQKRVAILAGGGLALVLRIVLTAVASFLLQIPLLQLLGGLVLGWVTYRLVSEEAEEESGSQEGEMKAAEAIRLIIIADLTMSTDNVLAVGAVARGNIPLLLIGLTLSMAIVVLGGTLVSLMMNKMPWLTWVGALVLVVLAGEMVSGDAWAVEHHLVPGGDWFGWVVSLAMAAVIGGALLVRQRRRDRASRDLRLERESDGAVRPDHKAHSLISR